MGEGQERSRMWGGQRRRQVCRRNMRKEGGGGIRIKSWVMSSIWRDTSTDVLMYCLITSTIFCMLEVASAGMANRRDISSGRMIMGSWP